MKTTIQAMADDREKRIKQLRLFDAGIWLGEPVGFPLAFELPPEQLPSALKDHCITGGLVSHWRSYTVSAQEGNLALAGLAPDLPPNCYVIWTALPLYPPEQGPVPGRGRLPDSVRGARIFPVRGNFPLATWILGPLCAWLTEHALPLFIWHTELDWSKLRSLAKDFPELKMVVETQTKKILYHNRPLFALMRECPNVLLEISNFAGAGFVEFAVKEFGAERLIYGSFLPMNDPLVPAGMILDADISTADQKLIAGENLRRLIGKVVR